jgi:hypothetical protein
MAKDNKRLMMDQFQGKTTNEQIENLVGPINNLIDKAQLIDTQGIKLESGLGVVFKQFSVDVPSDWLEIGSTQAGAPPFQNGWRNFANTWETLAMRKTAEGVVVCKGLISSGTVATAGTGTVFTLPAAYQPPSGAGVHMPVASNGAFGLVKIQMDPATLSRFGSVEVTVGNNTYVSFRGCSWEANDRSPIIPACFPINIGVSMPRVADVRVVEVLDSFNDPVLTGPVNVIWQHLKDGKLSIKHIPGLKPSTSYKITVAVFPR